MKNANGYDTLFTDANGVPLAHEIESYNSGDFWAWVNVPLLVGGTDTTLYLYYGNSNISTPPDKTAVWDPNYKMVQHMNGDPGGGAPQEKDSTSNHNDGTDTNLDTSHLVDGLIGKGIQLDGTLSLQNIKLANTTSLQATTYGTFTGSAWVKLNDVTSNQKALAFMEPTGPPKLGYALGIQNGKIYPEIWDTAQNHPTFQAGTLSVGQWAYLAVTYDKNGQLIAYINGVQVGSTPPSVTT